MTGRSWYGHYLSSFVSRLPSPFTALFVTQYYPTHPLAAGWVCVTSFLPRRRGVLIPLWRNFVGAFGVVDKVKEEGFATAQK